jgi:hypothetical protein
LQGAIDPTAAPNPTPNPDPTPCRSTGSHCITASADSCLNLPDGDYQACEACTIYHSCSGGVNWSNRPCPAADYGGIRGKLVWQRITNNVGTCERSSTSCTECDQVSLFTTRVDKGFRTIMAIKTRIACHITALNEIIVRCSTFG